MLLKEGGTSATSVVPPFSCSLIRMICMDVTTVDNHEWTSYTVDVSEAPSPE